MKLALSFAGYLIGLAILLCTYVAFLAVPAQAFVEGAYWLKNAAWPSYDAFIVFPETSAELIASSMEADAKGVTQILVWACDIWISFWIAAPAAVIAFFGWAMAFEAAVNGSY